MGMCGKITFLLLTGIAVFIGIKLNALFEVPPLPQLENTWWGPGQQPAKIDTSIRPFKIQIPDKVIDDLKTRLKNVKELTPALEGSNQHYGMNSNLLKEILHFWQTKYNWRDREQYLNKYPQFKTNIQGLDLHYIHVKPSNPSKLKVLPLLMLHGWPGSVKEFYEIIPLLTAPRKGQDFVFELIIPSLPGYGFSDGAVRKGLGAAQMAVIFKNLMDRLNYKKFYVQGGDWGAIITNHLSVLYPENILGGHSNMCSFQSKLGTIKYVMGSLYPSLVVSEKHQHKLYPISSFLANLLLEFGYMHLQATKPDTIGVALNNSPIGLAAYIIEKFTTWTNPDFKNQEYGGLKDKYSYVDLLDNVMIYWVTNSITTSVRLYAESLSKDQMALRITDIPVTVPYACARFAHEILYAPDCLLKSVYKNLIQTSDYDDGGHFAAFEVPKLLAEDIWVAIGKMEKYHASEKAI